MKSTASDSPFLYLTSICLLLIIVFLMVFRRKLGDPKAGRFLLGYFVCYLYMAGITYFFVYGNPEPVIHTLRTGLFAALLMPVFAYFYIRQSLYPFTLRWRHLWHLLPAAVFLVNFMPFFLLPAKEKWEIYQAMDAVEYRLGFSQGWFVPKYGHIVIRLIIMLGYWLAQASILLRARKENFHPIRVQYPYTWRWLHLFLAIQAPMFIIPIVGVFMSSSQTEAVIYAIASAGAIAVQCFYILLHPEILYTETFGRELVLPGKKSIEENTPTIASVEPQVSLGDKEKNQPAEQKITESDLIQVEEKLKVIMETLKPYQIQGYTLHDFSADTGVLPYKLSAFINTRYGINFNDYLNKYRIDMVVDKLKAGENTQKTLEAIAQESGFQSRGTFIRAFKKEYGITPSEYLQSLKT